MLAPVRLISLQVVFLVTYDISLLLNDVKIRVKLPYLLFSWIDKSITLLFLGSKAVPAPVQHKPVNLIKIGSPPHGVKLEHDIKPVSFVTLAPKPSTVIVDNNKKLIPAPNLVPVFSSADQNSKSTISFGNLNGNGTTTILLTPLGLDLRVDYFQTCDWSISAWIVSPFLSSIQHSHITRSKFLEHYEASFRLGL